jgi:hypothetical protein
MNAENLSNLREPRNRGSDRNTPAAPPRPRARFDNARLSRVPNTPAEASASALAVLIARAEARLLWQAGELDLHEAVDELQAAAEASGLVDELGQNEVQAIIAKAFEAVR